MGPMQNTHGQKNKRKTMLIMLVLSLLILIPLCTVATYTWFGISKTPKVSDMEMTINANPGFELSWQKDTPDGEWSKQLAFVDAIVTDTVLTPVTWVDSESSFYTAKYGNDGRIVDLSQKLDDARDSNGIDGHYVKFTLYGKTGENVTVSLAPAVSSVDGTSSAGTYLIGKPEWQTDTKTHVDGGAGAQSAVRVGLKITKLDENLNETGNSDFYIYEPNADSHVDGSIGYKPTNAIGGGALVPETRLITQTTTLWQESYPVEHGVVVRTPGVFNKTPELFELEAGRRVKIDVYIWLEGMDVDCVNAVGGNAKLFANLQFDAKTQNDSGLVPIE